MYTPRGNAAKINRAITQCMQMAVPVQATGAADDILFSDELRASKDSVASQFEFDNDLVLDRD